MSSLTRLLKLAVFLLASDPRLSAFGAEGESQALPGADGRWELHDPIVPQSLRIAAQSTATLVRRSDIIPTAENNGSIRLLGQPVGDKLKLCPGSRFEHQPSSGVCSGFLITPSHILTAGHCIRSSADCTRLAAVFDYQYDHAERDPTLIRATSVFTCKQVVTRQTSHQEGIDYAIIELDRPTGRNPLPIRRQGRLSSEARLALIGSPNGMPLKVSMNGQVTNNEPSSYFESNLDSDTGNSGAPVVNLETLVVEGISVRGGESYKLQGHCHVRKNCFLEQCDPEEVLRAHTFIDDVNALNH